MSLFTCLNHTARRSSSPPAPAELPIGRPFELTPTGDSSEQPLSAGWYPLVLLVMFGLHLAGMGHAIGAEPADPRRPPAIQTRNVPVIPVEISERLRQYQAARGAAFRGWSPDGKGMLISTRFADTPQLHRVYEPGGRREQITFLEEPCDGLFLPRQTDGGMLVMYSAGGSENDNVYFLDRKQGRLQLLTDGKSRNLLHAVRKDGRQIVIGSNQRNGKETDLYLADPRKPGSMELLLPAEGKFWAATEWSPEGERLLLKQIVSVNEAYPAWMDLKTRKVQMLPWSSAKAGIDSLRWSADGKSIYLATDAVGEFRELMQMSWPEGKLTRLSEKIPWNVETIEIEEEGTRVALTVNEDGADRLYILEKGQMQPVDLPLGTIGSLEFSPDHQSLGFTFSRADAPADAWSLKLADRSLTQWTYSEIGGLNPASFIAPKRIRFPTFDQRQIPAYVYLPRTATAEKPCAVVINIHGGPESQYRPAFSGLDQFFLNELGIAVIHPNVRGSDGYGKSYLLLDNAEKREDSVKDIGALLDWIATQPELDSKRVAVMGASYGGYMVLGSLVNFGDRIKAGVDVVGIADFRTFLTTTAAYRRDLRRAEYGDERDPEMQKVFDQISPLKNAKRIRSGLMVVHGVNDPRVPFSEAQQIESQVLSQGQTVWSVYAENEGHGFAKKANRDYLTCVVTLFLTEMLGAK